MQQQNDSRCSCAKHWRHLKREAKQWCQIFVKCLLLHVLCSRLCWEELRCEDLQTEKGGCLSPVVPTLSCACLYLNLTLTDHLLCSQPAHLTHIHNQAQQWVSFLLFQSNSVVTHALRPAVAETLLGLKVKSLLFTQPWSSSLYHNPSPFQPNSAPLKLLRAPIRISPSACLTVFTTAFDPLIKRNTFTQNLARSCIITTAA